MVFLRSVALLFGLLSVPIGCSRPTETATTLAADIVSATRDADGTISFEVEWRNLATVPAYMPACGQKASMWLEQRGPSGWTNFGGGVCIHVLDQSPVRIEPNESIRATVSVGKGPPGEYRAVTSVSADPSQNGELVRSAGAQVR